MLYENIRSDLNTEQRQKAFKKLLICISVFFCVFSIFNYFNGLFPLYALEFGIFIFASIIIWKFESIAITKKTQLFAIIFSNVLFLYLTYALSVVGVSKTTHLWIIAIPILSYTLTGMKWGFNITCFYLVLISTVLSIKFFNPTLFNLESTVDFAFLLIGVWLLSHLYEKSNTMAAKKLYLLATQDALTKLYNRHAFFEFFKEEQTTIMSLLIIDLDWFKQINDTYGHDAGDFALIQTAEVLKEHSPSGTEAFRLGGEEFAIMMPDFTLEESVHISKRILKTLENKKMTYLDKNFHLTASIGIASSVSDTNLDRLMRQADKCLYQAKANGRNRVESAYV